MILVADFLPALVPGDPWFPPWGVTSLTRWAVCWCGKPLPPGFDPEMEGGDPSCEGIVIPLPSPTALDRAGEGVAGFSENDMMKIKLGGTSISTLNGEASSPLNPSLPRRDSLQTEETLVRGIPPWCVDRLEPSRVRRRSDPHEEVSHNAHERSEQEEV
jgi:hypothetical protein